MTDTTDPTEAAPAPKKTFLDVIHDLVSLVHQNEDTRKEAHDVIEAERQSGPDVSRETSTFNPSPATSVFGDQGVDPDGSH